MAFTQLGEVNRPSIVVWPLCSSEAAWKSRDAILLGGDVDGT